MTIQISPNGRRREAETRIIVAWWTYRKGPKDDLATVERIIAINAVFNEFGEEILTPEELVRIRDTVMDIRTITKPESVLEEYREN